jgi:hypothetical protein
MLINKFVSEIICHVMAEAKKESNIEVIKDNVVNPLIDYTFHRLYPYILITAIVFFLTFILAVITFLLLVKSQS